MGVSESDAESYYSLKASEPLTTCRAASRETPTGDASVCGGDTDATFGVAADDDAMLLEILSNEKDGLLAYKRQAKLFAFSRDGRLGPSARPSVNTTLRT